MKRTVLLLPLALLSAPAVAYVGPGAGLGVIGTLFGILAALVLATFGLLWYPLKRAFARKGAAPGGTDAAPPLRRDGAEDAAAATPRGAENAETGDERGR